jgi:hypothetical protein
MADSTKHYPLTIESVRKIKEQNIKGIKPETLETVEIVSGKPKEVEPEFVDVVGQITLKSLEKNNRKKRENDRKGNVSDKGTANGRQPKTSRGRPQQNPPAQKNNQRPVNNRNRPPKKSS